MPRRPPVVSPIREVSMIQRSRVDELWRTRDFRALIFLGVLATLTLILAIAIRGILGPFIVAGILALMLNPIVNAAERRRVPRIVAVLVLYGVLGAALAAGILFLVPLIQQEFSSLVAQGPAIASYFQDLADKEHVVSVLGVPIDLRQAYNDSVHNLPALLAGHLSSVVENVFMLVNWLFQTVLVLLVIYFVISNVIYNFISPKVFGDAVHLSPMLIIIAFVVGGYLGGILGLFVAVPMAATLRILFTYAHERVYA